jgi:hypothetical protein
MRSLLEPSNYRTPCEVAQVERKALLFPGENPNVVCIPLAVSVEHLPQLSEPPTQPADVDLDPLPFAPERI